MAITFNSNVVSLGAQRKLSDATDLLSKISQRLSSGLRINTASDDAAGLAIATGLNVSSRVYSQGIRNVNDGISVLSIADQALSSLSTITQRQAELAEQSANGSYSTSQRVALNSEVNALSQEYNRILDTTTFNGVSLFKDSASGTELRIQAGYGTAESLSITLGADGARSVGSGTFTVGSTSTFGLGYYTTVILADFNNDGKADIFNSCNGQLVPSVSLGNGDGTFQALSYLSSAGSGINATATGDFDGDGNVDIAVAASNYVVLYHGNGNGTFKAGLTYSPNDSFQDIEVADVNGDGRDDLVGVGNGIATVLLGKSDGTFATGFTFDPGTNSGSTQMTLIHQNPTGPYTLVSSIGTGGLAVATRLNSAGLPTGITQSLGNLSNLAGADLNGDGYGDLVAKDANTGNYVTFFGNADGSLRSGTVITSVDTNTNTFGTPNSNWTITDINGDGIKDIVAGTTNGIASYLGNSDGSFKAGTVSSGGAVYTVSAGDINGDGVTDLATDVSTPNAVEFWNGNATRTLRTKRFDITTRAGSLQALDFLNNQIGRISMGRSSVGAFESRLDISLSNLQSTRENYTTAAHQILDSDTASDVAELTKAKILQQVGAAVLSQANLQPQLTLRLLQQ